MQIVRTKIAGVTVTSDYIETTRGVPQGSVLGPFLFLVYINDLPQCCKLEESLYLFADDTAILYSAPSFDILQRNIDQSLTELTTWFQQNGLRVNIPKTQTIKFGNYGDNPSQIQLESMENLSISESVKFLGILIDRKLSWSQHIDQLTNKISSYVYLLRTLSTKVSQEDLISTYHGLVESSLRHGILVWGGSVHSRDVLLMQKKCLRVIAGVKARATCRPLFRRFGILTATDLYVLTCAIFYKKHSDLFQCYVIGHDHETRHKAAAQVKTVQTQLHVVYSGVCNRVLQIYNSIPPDIKSLSFKKFKVGLKRYLVNRCDYSLNEYFAN